MTHGIVTCKPPACLHDCIRRTSTIYGRRIVECAAQHADLPSCRPCGDPNLIPSPLRCTLPTQKLPECRVQIAQKAQSQMQDKDDLLTLFFLAQLGIATCTPRTHVRGDVESTTERTGPMLSQICSSNNPPTVTISNGRPTDWPICRAPIGGRAVPLGLKEQLDTSSSVASHRGRDIACRHIAGQQGWVKVKQIKTGSSKKPYPYLGLALPAVASLIDVAKVDLCFANVIPAYSSIRPFPFVSKAQNCHMP